MLLLKQTKPLTHLVHLNSMQQTSTQGNLLQINKTDFFQNGNHRTLQIPLTENEFGDINITLVEGKLFFILCSHHIQNQVLTRSFFIPHTNEQAQRLFQAAGEQDFDDLEELYALETESDNLTITFDLSDAHKKMLEMFLDNLPTSEN